MARRFLDVRSYALAVVAVALAILLGMLPTPLFGAHQCFLTLLAAVVFTSAYGGPGPALLALALGSLGFAYFGLSPCFSSTTERHEYLFGLPLFITICLGSIALFERLRSAQQRAEDSAAEARDRAARLEEQAKILSARDAEFRAMFENVTVGMAQVAVAQLRFLSVNDCYCRITGYSRDELLGMTPLDLDHPEDREPDRLAFARLEKGETLVYRTEKRYIRKDGRIIWVQVTASLVREGGPVRSIGIIEDITDRKLAHEALRRSEAQLRRLFESDIVGIAYSDRYGSFSDGNDEFLRIVGYGRDDLLAGRVRWIDMTPAQYLPLDERGIAEAEERGACTPYEKEYVRKDGSPVPILIGYALLEGSRDHFIAMIQDLTRPKQLEAELRRQAEALREANLRKDEFLAMLGHELRNPLAPIRNALEILRVEESQARAALSGERSSEAAVQARAMMERQVEHLIRLVDDLLDVSRLVENKITLQRTVIDLAAVLERAIETAGPVIEARGHHLNVSLPPTPVFLEADLVRLSQVVSNLLLNSAKYTEPGGSIEVTAERGLGEVVVRVKDSGVGMAADLLPRVFDLFVQAERSLARSQGGLGIGLTLVRKLVELHNGKVSAFSAGPGKGSEFVVRLPALPEGWQHHRPTPPTPRPRPRSVPRRILVVDDHPDVAESAALLLRLWGHEVHTVADGPAALQAVLSFRPEVVLLDIGLPGMDGYEVARRLRQHPDTRTVLLAALTGYGQEEDRRKSKEAGFDCHLTKPINPDTLQAFLASPSALP
jgi:PAS domain S-box-containing protein